MLATYRDAGRMNLRVAWIREESAFLIRAPGSSHVAAFGIGRKEKYVSVTARGEDDSIRRMRRDFAVDEVASYDAFGMAVNDDQVEHFRARKHLDRSQGNLAAEGLVSAEEKLLAGLAARVKSAGDLRAAERAIGEQTAVFASKGDSLGHALINDVYADLRETINVGFARAEVPALDRVVKEPINAVTIVLIIFGSVD